MKLLKRFLGRWSKAGRGLVPEGPGRNDRKGVSLIELFEKFPDNRTAEQWFEDVRWSDVICCPRCGCYGMISECPNRKPQAYWCGDCRKRFSVRTGTVLECSHVSYQKWAIAIYLHLSSLKGVSSMKLHRDLRVTQKTAWFMAHRIRAAWSDQRPLRSKIAEIDEAYFGGKERNKHADRKLHERWTEGKTAVVGMKDRRTGKVVAEVIPNTESDTLRGFARKHLRRRGTLYSDSATAYQGFDWPNRHKAVRHSRGEYVDGDAHVNGMESFWSTIGSFRETGFHPRREP